MSELIKIGSSGVRVNQANLQVTGHNIANVDTDGYTRQQAVQITNPSIAWGNGHYGQGASTETIRRVVDEFTVTQLRNDTSLAKEREMVYQYASQLDNLMADPDSSPGNALNEFFSAMQSLADDPNNMTLRNQVLAQGDSLSQRFNLMQERFDDLQESINVQLEGTVGEVNRIASNIAELNTAIVEAEGKNGLPANDLRDAREEQLRVLSEYVDVSLTKVNDGTYSVFIGEGFPLVVNDENYELSAEPMSNDIKRLGIVYPQRDGDKDITNIIHGGELGGVLKFRDEILTTTQNQIGRLALAIGESFNEQHKLGIDLNNEVGNNFFKDVNDLTSMENRVSAFKENSGSTNLKLSVEISDTNGLTDKDYVLKAVTGDTFAIYDMDGNPLRFSVTKPHPTIPGQTTTVNPTTVKLSDLNRFDDAGGVNSDEIKVSVDGFDLYLSSSAATQVSKDDRFVISPTRYASGEMKREVTTAEELAIALPLRSEAAQSNTGGGEVRSTTVGESFSSAPVTQYPLALASSPNPTGSDSESGSYSFVDDRDGSFKTYLGTPDAASVAAVLPATVAATINTAGATAHAVAANVSTSFAAFNTHSTERSVAGKAFTAADTVASNFEQIKSLSSGAATVASTAAAVVGATQSDVADAVAGYLSDQGASAQVIADTTARIKGAANVANARDGAAFDVAATTLSSALYDTGADSTTVTAAVLAIDTAKAAAPAGPPAPVPTDADFAAAASGAANAAATAEANFIQANSIGANIGVYELTQGLTVEFSSKSATDSNKLNYEVRDPASGMVIHRGEYTQGTEQSMLPESWGVQLNIGGQPAVGDSFSVNYNTDGFGDNSNALRLTALQGEPTLEGDMSYQDAYAGTTTGVGSQTAEAKITAQSGAAILEQTRNLRDSVSGVNMDEEAANLVRFQQAYNASSQIISTARQLFDTLLAAVR